MWIFKMELMVKIVMMTVTFQSIVTGFTTFMIKL